VSRALVLLSGGKDSAIALWWAMANHDDVTALSLDHADRPRREVLAARRLAKAAGSELIEGELPFVRSMGSARVAYGAGLDTAGAYIPMRNLLFFAAAGYFAEKSGVERIVGGQLRSDGAAYPDATPQFFDALGKLLALTVSGGFTGDVHSLTVDLPLMTLSDAQAVQLGLRLGVPFEMSWSCLHDGDFPCRVCVSCRDRARALVAGAAANRQQDRSIPDSRGES
jgi:7-cyano-7-deazaguanine synthase